MSIFSSQQIRSFSNKHHYDNIIDGSRGALLLSRYRKGIAIDKRPKRKLFRPFEIARKQDRSCLFSFLRQIPVQVNGVSRIWAGRMLANDYRGFYLKALK